MAPKWLAHLVRFGRTPPPPPPPPPPAALLEWQTLLICALAVVALLLALRFASFICNRREYHGKILGPSETPAPLASLEPLKCGFASKRIPEGIDTIIIGSGMGGLTTGALLAKRGQRVLVLEQHDVAGGCTHTFDEKGYEFDTGLHYVGDMLGTLFNTITTGRIEWAGTGGLVDEVFFGADDRVPIRAPKAAFLAELRERFPSEGAALRWYPWAVLWSHVALSLHLASKSLPLVLGWPLARLLGRMRTTADGLAALTDNVKLRQLLSYIWGTYGVAPSRSPFAFHLVLQNHYFNGGYYPVGGCAQLAARIVPTILAAGGAVLVRAPVTSLAFDDVSGALVGVHVRGSTLIRARRVVSAAGALNTFCRLVPDAHRHRVASAVAAIRDGPPTSPPAATERGVEPSVAFLYLFLGIRDDAGDLGPLPKHNLWCFPSWDHEGTCELPPALDDLAADHPLLLFISSPSAKDPAWAARKGGARQVVLALAPTRYEYWARWRGARIKHRGDEYEAVKRRLQRRLMDMVLDKLPQLRGRVDYADLGTPLSNDYYLGTSWGEAYGLAHTPSRFAQRWLRPRTPIRNLFLSGQDVATDGVAGGVLSGVLTASTIDPRVMLSEGVAAGVVAATLQAVAT